MEIKDDEKIIKICGKLSEMPADSVFKCNEVKCSLCEEICCDSGTGADNFEELDMENPQPTPTPNGILCSDCFQHVGKIYVDFLMVKYKTK